MPKRLDQSSKDAEMSIEAETRQLLWEVVPPQIHEGRKSWLWRAARTLGWGHRRTRAIFYCEARTITAEEWRSLNQRLDALKAATRRREEAAHELRSADRMAGEELPVAGRDTEPDGRPADGTGAPRSAKGRSA
jgi:hypothetical protein